MAEVSPAPQLNIGQRFNPYRASQAMFIPLRMARYKGLSWTEKGVYACLRQHAGKRGYCWPDQETIAEDAAISRNRVSEVLSTLESKGFIERVRNGRRIEVFFLYHQIFAGTQADPGDDISNLPDIHEDPDVSNDSPECRDSDTTIDPDMPTVEIPTCRYSDSSSVDISTLDVDISTPHVDISTLHVDISTCPITIRNEVVKEEVHEGVKEAAVHARAPTQLELFSHLFPGRARDWMMDELNFLNDEYDPDAVTEAIKAALNQPTRPRAPRQWINARLRNKNNTKPKGESNYGRRTSDDYGL